MIFNRFRFVGSFLLESIATLLSKEFEELISILIIAKILSYIFDYSQGLLLWVFPWYNVYVAVK